MPSSLAVPKNWLPEEDTLGRQEARRAAEPTRSVGLGDCLSDGVHPPGLRDKGDVGWYVLRADIAGGEHDLEIRPQTLRRFGQFGSAHAGHADIREQNLDLGVGLEQLEGVVTVVGVEHLTAEVLHDADCRSADLGHVLDYEHGKLALRHGSNS